jgi:tripartite-type tricarboxylate transporter receptor subunit TctC
VRTRCVRLVLLLLLGTIAAGRPLHAQDWPRRPVRIVVPYAAGGITDDVAHVAAERLAGAFGQPFVLEHRPGAAGALATEAVVRSAADGYTLLLAGLPQIAIVPVTSRHRARRGWLAGRLLGAAVVAAAAGSFPSRPIRVLVPAAAGGRAVSA